MKVQCKHCNVEFDKLPSQCRGNNFCSRSCANTYNNIKYPKRIRTIFNYCQCGTSINKNCKRCSKCLVEDFTLGEAIERYSKHHKSSAFALVRVRARKIAKQLGMKVCQKCGYSKHVEIAHKKAISSYPLTTLISVVNSQDNLMALCPNCHWEFDNKYPDADSNWSLRD